MIVICVTTVLLTNSNKFKLWTFSLKLTLLKEILLLVLNNIINIDKVVIDFISALQRTINQEHKCDIIKSK